jgi:hypothetical protein
MLGRHVLCFRKAPLEGLPPVHDDGAAAVERAFGGAVTGG